MPLLDPRSMSLRLPRVPPSERRLIERGLRAMGRDPPGERPVAYPRRRTDGAALPSKRRRAAALLQVGADAHGGERGEAYVRERVGCHASHRNGCGRETRTDRGCGQASRTVGRVPDADTLGWRGGGRAGVKIGIITGDWDGRR